MKIFHNTKITVAVAAAAAIGVYLFFVYLLAYLGFNGTAVSTIPPVAALVVVVIFFYLSTNASAERQEMMIRQQMPEVARPPRKQHCIILTASTHGVMQDRFNNWLEGGYGKVISTSLAINEKGFFMTVTYEPVDEKNG